MKTKLYSLIAALLLPFVSYGSIAFSGTALNGASGVNIGDYSVLLFDTSGAGFNSAGLNLIDANATLSSSATYGSGFEVAAVSAAADFFGIATIVEYGFSYSLGTISDGDSFGILTFAGGSSATAVGGTSYSIFTDSSWTSPADGAAVTFGSDLNTLSSAAGASGTVTAVPEPSTYATLAGLLALGFVMLRRRG
jgi:hypothetical protein